MDSKIGTHAYYFHEKTPLPVAIIRKGAPVPTKSGAGSIFGYSDRVTVPWRRRRREPARHIQAQPLERPNL